MNIGTYSIRAFNLSDWGFKNWLFRRADVSDVILKHDLRVCAIQEAGGFFHRRSLLAKLNQDFDHNVYAYYGGSVGVLYRKDFFSVFDKGSFAITNPYSFIGSTDSFVWVGLQDRVTGQKFYVFSVVLQKCKNDWSLDKKLNNLRAKIAHVLWGSRQVPFVIAGTFNFNPVDDLAQYTKFTSMFPGLKDASREALLKVNEVHGTYNNFNKDIPDLTKRFDYILTSGFRLPLCKTVETRDKRGSFPSDHFPIVLFCEYESQN